MNNSEIKQSSVLYVEDTPSNLKLVARVLESQLNVSMLSVSDPFVGLILAKRYLPKLILLDIKLPGIDGFEVLKQLKLHAATLNIPVIAITSNGMSGDIERGIAAGFDDYIVKPINIKSFIQAVNRYL